MLLCMAFLKNRSENTQGLKLTHFRKVKIYYYIIWVKIILENAPVEGR
jgi:hypothetical protein